MIKTSLHYSYILPGGIDQPPLMQIINEKLDLVDRLNLLIDGRVSDSPNSKKIKEMIQIEMDAIYEMIQLDKQENQEKTNKFEF